MRRADGGTLTKLVHTYTHYASTPKNYFLTIKRVITDTGLSFLFETVFLV